MFEGYNFRESRLFTDKVRDFLNEFFDNGLGYNYDITFVEQAFHTVVFVRHPYSECSRYSGVIYISHDGVIVGTDYFKAFSDGELRVICERLIDEEMLREDLTKTSLKERDGYHHNFAVGALFGGVVSFTVCVTFLLRLLLGIDEWYVLSFYEGLFVTGWITLFTILSVRSFTKARKFYKDYKETMKLIVQLVDLDIYKVRLVTRVRHK